MAIDADGQASLESGHDGFDSWNSALFNAGACGSVQEALAAVEGGASVSVVNARKHTALMVALDAGQFEVAMALAKRMSPAQINMQGEAGMTAMDFAVVKNRPEMVRLLAKLGGSIENSTSCGFTSLMAAARLEGVEVVNAMLELKANAKAVDKDGQSPLWIALDCGQKEVALALMPTSDLDIEVGGKNLLMLACAANMDWAVSSLANQGSLAKLDPSGRSAFDYAVAQCAIKLGEKGVELVSSLLPMVEIWKSGEADCSALSFLAKTDGHAENMELLAQMLGQVVLSADRPDQEKVYALAHAARVAESYGNYGVERVFLGLELVVKEKREMEVVAASPPVESKEGWVQRRL